MTASETLREMLDERGVEWQAPSDNETWWETEGNNHWSAEENGDGEYLTFEAITCLTPAQAIAATLGAGTCDADETDLIPFVRADNGYFKVDYIHVMECGACGGTYEHVSGGYEFCPRCGARVVEVDE